MPLASVTPVAQWLSTAWSHRVQAYKGENADPRFLSITFELSVTTLSVDLCDVIREIDLGIRAKPEDARPRTRAG